ncbi:hypothetical protein TanjilG_24493 [Lupinus angustifolius]|uniref:HSF-type DNA-binding domain-containing protein n=1 Tax=Lupinus angustifolius TaxID=3871 RepID=A0A394D913_LUPAN|nr:PREDICTED: heat stress transcription factor B-4-like [Lupinus angustifolius]OIW19794.1 hypothetical protein TanjilG_24493 [Lupinus angustifolius]
MDLLLDNSEGLLLSLDSHKSVPAPFLTKTYQLVDDPNTNHIVSWGENDTTFVVWRPPEFARDVLSNYFKHNNFSSFVRQLNTYGFRKIVPDRWEFANEFFKKGEKHLLCEIHRRKTAQPQQVTMNHNHHLSSPLATNNVPSFFPFHDRVSISPPTDSNELPIWCDSPPLTSPTSERSNYNTSVTALSEDNERLRKSNNVLLSELAHMKKLYNDIIYFVQNHVKHVPPNNNTYYPSAPIMMQRQMNKQVKGCYYDYYSTNPRQNSPSNTSRSSITIFEKPGGNSSCKTKLCGVSLQSKKRVHPEYGSNNVIDYSEINYKTRLVLEKDDELSLKLMLPNPSC